MLRAAYRSFFGGFSAGDGERLSGDFKRLLSSTLPFAPMFHQGQRVHDPLRQEDIYAQLPTH